MPALLTALAAVLALPAVAPAQSSMTASLVAPTGFADKTLELRAGGQADRPAQLRVYRREGTEACPANERNFSSLAVVNVELAASAFERTFELRRPREDTPRHEGSFVYCAYLLDNSDPSRDDPAVLATASAAYYEPRDPSSDPELDKQAPEVRVIDGVRSHLAPGTSSVPWEVRLKRPLRRGEPFLVDADPADEQDRLTVLVVEGRSCPAAPPATAVLEVSRSGKDVRKVLELKRAGRYAVCSWSAPPRDRYEPAELVRGSFPLAVGSALARPQAIAFSTRGRPQFTVFGACAGTIYVKATTATVRGRGNSPFYPFRRVGSGRYDKSFFCSRNRLTGDIVMNFFMIAERYIGSGDPRPSRDFTLPRGQIDQFVGGIFPRRRARGGVKAAKGSKIYRPGFRRVEKLYNKGL